MSYVHRIATDLRIAHSNCCTSREFVTFGSNERKCSIVAKVGHFITSSASRCCSLGLPAAESKGRTSLLK